MDTIQKNRLFDTTSLVIKGSIILIIATFLASILSSHIKLLSDMWLFVLSLPLVALWGSNLGVKCRKEIGYMTSIIFLTFILACILLVIVGASFFYEQAFQSAIIFVFYVCPIFVCSAFLGVLFSNIYYSSHKQ